MHHLDFGGLFSTLFTFGSDLFSQIFYLCNRNLHNRKAMQVQLLDKFVSDRGSFWTMVTSKSTVFCRIFAQKFAFKIGCLLCRGTWFVNVFPELAEAFTSMKSWDKSNKASKTHTGQIEKVSVKGDDTLKVCVKWFLNITELIPQNCCTLYLRTKLFTADLTVNKRVWGGERWGRVLDL